MCGYYMDNADDQADMFVSIIFASSKIRWNVSERNHHQCRASAIKKLHKCLLTRSWKRWFYMFM